MANAREFLQDRVLLALAVSVLGTPAMAGESREPDAAAVPAGGAITYSRDVHHSIGSTYFLGQSHDAVTAPTGAIIGAIALGLSPLTDNETARVTASLPQTVEHATLWALAVSEQGALSSRAGGGMPAHSAAMAGGAAISRTMGALSGALGSLSVITGGGQ